MNTAEPIRVLFLTRYPLEGASSRYRVFQYLPHLERLGIACTVSSFMDNAMYRASARRGGTLRKVAMAASASVRRIGRVLSAGRYDAVYMQRELLPFGPPLLERWLKRRGLALLFDYDDALFIKKPSRYNPLATLLRSPGKVQELFRIADVTVAGNDWLRDAAREAGGHAVTVEVAEDVARYPKPERASAIKPVTIGWLGSPSTVKYLHTIAAPLRRIAQHHPDVRWEIMGGDEFAMEGVPWRLSEWSMDGEVAALARFDIGLMPLPSEEWSRGKSGGKARTYMAAGVVPVVSAIGYNRELVRHGETGFLCETEADWTEALERLVADPPLRRIIANAARRDVAERFDPARQAGKIADLIRETIAQKNAAA